ncbi:hypothetical protein EVAR_36910_1 [Eumeta japonica]|uniref:Uncharacterized protein n=1 Tax=Eumeta variegata TaxID=151549 RepID=A0A4C1X3Y3_EUMVA|nr:hypothetical protein EVAR_36910_1 [Eumeta japonica]
MERQNTIVQDDIGFPCKKVQIKRNRNAHQRLTLIRGLHDHGRDRRRLSRLFCAVGHWRQRRSRQGGRFSDYLWWLINSDGDTIYSIAIHWHLQPQRSRRSPVRCQPLRIPYINGQCEILLRPTTHSSVYTTSIYQSSPKSTKDKNKIRENR